MTPALRVTVAVRSPWRLLPSTVAVRSPLEITPVLSSLGLPRWLYGVLGDYSRGYGQAVAVRSPRRLLPFDPNTPVAFRSPWRLLPVWRRWLYAVPGDYSRRRPFAGERWLCAVLRRLLPPPADRLGSGCAQLFGDYSCLTVLVQVPCPRAGWMSVCRPFCVTPRSPSFWPPVSRWNDRPGGSLWVEWPPEGVVAIFSVCPWVGRRGLTFGHL